MIHIDSSEVERFIRYASTFLGYPQVSLKDIRDRQDDELTHQIYRKTAEYFKSSRLNRLEAPTFFAGSVDFMVHRQDKGDNRYYVLETNGGNSRGFAVLPEEQWALAYGGYLETLAHCKDKRPLVLVGHPKRDLLLYEKVFLAEAFSDEIKRLGKGEGKIAGIEDYLARKADDAQVIVGPYDKIMPVLSLAPPQVMLSGVPLSIVIGDGVVRRHPIISRHLLTEVLETIVVNDVFHISDDKALTYQAVQESREVLRPFGIQPIRCWRGKNRFELQQACREALTSLGQVVIKPHGGSGGAGIDIITNMQAIGRKIEESVAHYREKFGPDRDPFPYTVSQLIDATPVVWKGRNRKYDVRVYLARRGDAVHALGGLIRIALEPFTGEFTKRTFVVNLSGYGGVDTERGLGVSESTLALLGLDEDDFTRMFAAAAVITAYIANNHARLGEAALAGGWQLDSSRS